MSQSNENFERELLLHLARLPQMGTAFAREDKLESRDFRKPWMQAIWGAAAAHFQKYKEWPIPALLMTVVNGLYDGENLKESERPLVEEFFCELLSRPYNFNPVYYGVECERFIESRRAAKVFNRGIKGELGLDQAISDLCEIRTKVRAQRTASVDPFASPVFQDYGRCVKTGFSSLDFRLPGGGHMEGRTMLVVGFTSSGKSTVLRSIEAGAALNRHRVLVVTLEDAIPQVASKLYSNLAGVPATLLFNKDFRTPEMLQRVQKCCDDLKGYIHIIDPYDQDASGNTQAKPCTVEDIEAMVQQEIEKGFSPDLLTIDYLNRIQLEEKEAKGLDEAQILRRISEKLKDRLAKRFKLPVITCGQANGDGFDQAILQIIHMARGKEAAWAFDVVGTLGSPRTLASHFNKQGDKLGDDEEESMAIQEAARLTPQDLLAGRCPLKIVHFNLAKVRDGMVGHFPLYADFCYGRYTEPGALINTINGIVPVDQIRDRQVEEEERLKLAAKK